MVSSRFSRNPVILQVVAPELLQQLQQLRCHQSRLEALLHLLLYRKTNCWFHGWTISHIH